MLKPMDRKKGKSAAKAGNSSEARNSRIQKPGVRGCGNKECRLRKAGCAGFEGCPGYKATGG